MTTAGPWSVKGIDPKAREIAKDLARRSGMTLGEWLNHMIIEGEDEAPVQEGSPFDRAWLDAPRTRTQAAAFSATESLRARINRELGREEPSKGREVGVGHNSEAGEVQRLGKLLAEMSSRIEGSEERAAEQGAAAARAETSIDEMREDQGQLNERLRRFDEEEGARLEAIQALEGALNKVAGQIHEGETRARHTLSELRENVSALARRVDRAESASDKAAEDRLEAVAAELTRKVEAVRDETAARLKEASDGKFERLEQAVRSIASKVGEGEKRSGEAINRIGREVERATQSLSGRVRAVEGRSAAAAEKMGGEMARIAEAMESRMRQADAAQAQSLEKLGGELARIAEKLADRIAASERRAAGAMTHMGDQLASITDGVNQRNDSVAADIAERIRASEERTAKLLAETRDSLDRRMALAQGSALDAGAFAGPAIAEAPPHVLSPANPSADPFAADEFEPHFSAPAPAYDDPFDPLASHDAFDAFHTDRPFEDFASEPPFESEPAYDHTDLYPAAAERTTTPPAKPAPQTKAGGGGARDLIASARAAARAAAESRGRRPAASVDPFAASTYDAGFPAGEFSSPEVEVAAERARTSVLGFGFPIPRKARKDGPTLKTLLMASGVAATLSVTAVGAVGLVALDAKNGSKRDAPSAAPDPQTALAALERSANDPLPPATTASDPGSGDRLAMALSNPDTSAAPVLKPTVPTAAAAPAALPATAAAKPLPVIAPAALYAASIRQIEAKNPAGLEGLKKAANLGYAPAEFYLAKLFETGNSGMRKDAAEARRWTERAADAGDAKAMHNLALYWFEGSGGAKDPAQAADWFKRAAEHGVQDSQYNLARLYEQGFGVSKSPAEAYKWYLVAGASGDAEAKKSADALKRQLSPDAQAGAERAASSLRAQIAGGQLRTASAE